MDITTRWPEAIPLRATTTTECARALISTWIARFGVPLDMTSDRGLQFTSAMWSTVSSQLGIQLHRTTAYHPQANGLVERFHSTLKASLKAQLSSPNWVDELPWVLSGIRLIPKDDLQASSAELVYGEPLMIPGDFTSPNSTPWDATNLKLVPKISAYSWWNCQAHTIACKSRSTIILTVCCSSPWVFCLGSVRSG